MHSRKRESALKYHFSVNFAILFMPTFDVLTQNIAFWHILGTSKAILLIFVLKCNEYNGPILLCIPLFINGTYLFGIFREKEQVLFMTAWPITRSSILKCRKPLVLVMLYNDTQHYNEVAKTKCGMFIILLIFAFSLVLLHYYSWCTVCQPH